MARMGSSVSQLVVAECFIGGVLTEVYERLEGHRSEPATINDLALTAPRFETGLIRNIVTELYCVLIMVTRDEHNGWRSRFEPFSTFTVDLLAATFNGDLLDALDRF